MQKSSENKLKKKKTIRQPTQIVFSFFTIVKFSMLVYIKKQLWSKLMTTTTTSTKGNDEISFNLNNFNVTCCGIMYLGSFCLFKSN